MRRRARHLGFIAVLLLGAAWIPTWFFLNLYLQQVLGFGSFAGGAALLPMTALIMILMVGVTERVIVRLGFRVTLMWSNRAGRRSIGCRPARSLCVAGYPKDSQGAMG